MLMGVTSDANTLGLVSIIVPLYNSEKTILPTFNSLVNSSYKNIEILLIDDGSNDNTKSICEEFVKIYNNVKYFRKKNGGVASARNFGISKARGQFIALCDHDDYWVPNKLEKQIVLFQNNNVGVVYSGSYTLDDSGIMKKRIYDRYYEGACSMRILVDNCIPASSVVIRKECLNSVGFFEENRLLSGVDDKHLWVRISKEYNVLAVREELIIHRTGSNCYSFQEDKMFDAEIFCLEDLKKYISDQSGYELFMRRAFKNVYSHYGKNFFHMGNYEKARHCFFLLVKYKIVSVYLFYYIICLFPYSIISRARISFKIFKEKFFCNIKCLL